MGSNSLSIDNGEDFLKSLDKDILKSLQSDLVDEVKGVNNKGIILDQYKDVSDIVSSNKNGKIKLDDDEDFDFL